MMQFKRPLAPLTRHRPASRTIWYLLGLGAIALGFAFFALGYFLYQAAIKAIVSSLPDSQLTRVALKGGLEGLFFCVVMAWVHMIIRIGRRLWARGANQHTNDKRPPVLYLRSFVYDEKTRPGVSVSFEERLVGVLSQMGPVVTIGQPGERLPPVGARRLYPSSADWQAVVLDLMQSAVAVVLQAGVTDGVRWEAEAVVRHVDPRRVLVVTTGIDEAYRGFARAMGHLFPRGLPPERDSALWVTFDRDWSPQPLGLANWKWLIGQTPGTAAGIAESLRPFCSALGAKLGTVDRTLSAVGVPAVCLLLAIVGGFLLPSLGKVVVHDLRLALEVVPASLLVLPKELMPSEKRTFSVALPTGWKTVTRELRGRLPNAPSDFSVDRLVLMRERYGVMADFQKLSQAGDLDVFTEAAQQQFLLQGAQVLAPPGARSVAGWPAREFRLSTLGFHYVVLLVDTGGSVYYVRFWGPPGWLVQPDVEALVASIQPHV